MAIIPCPDLGDPYDNGASLHAAIASATFGDRIQLAQNVEYRTTLFNPFTLTNKGAGTGTDADYIFIETNNMALLPDGVRVVQGDEAKLAKITTDGYDNVLFLHTGAHHWRLQGLFVTITSKSYDEGQTCNSALTCNDTTPVGPWPHHIVLDRLLVRPPETGMTNHFRSLQRGLLLSGADLKLMNSSICGFGGWSTPYANNPGSFGDSYRNWLVTAATNANPCVLTLGGDAANTYPDDGWSIKKKPMPFRGGTGTGWSTLNTTLCAERVDDTHVKVQYYDPATGVKTNVDSTTWPAFATSGPGSGPQQLMRLNTVLNDASAITDSVGPGPFEITNCLLEASTYCIITGGGGSFIPAQNKTTVVSVIGIDEVELAALGDIAVGDVIAFELSAPQPISAATVSTALRITVPTHRFTHTPTGGPRIGNSHPYIRFMGFTGDWAVLNCPVPSTQLFYGRAVSATQVDIYVCSSAPISGVMGPPVNTSGFAAYTGGATWQIMSPLATTGGAGTEDDSWQVGIVTDVNPTTKRIKYDFHGTGGIPEVSNGNGAGTPVQAGCVAQHNGIHPHGWTLRRSDLFQPRYWMWLLRDRCKTIKSSGSGPKGCWENKSCFNVSVEGCRWGISGGPMGIDDLGQPIGGTQSVTFNQVDQTGNTPWVKVSDWVVRYNIFYGCSIFIGHVDEWLSSKQSQNFTFEHNLMTYAPGDYFLHHFTSMKNAIIRHNTVRNGETAIAAIGASTNIIMDNIYCYGPIGYQYHTDFAPYIGLEEGPGHIENNYAIDNKAKGAGFFVEARYDHDVYVASEAAMGFVDMAGADAGGDYHGYMLAAGSPGKGQSISSPGKDVGVDFALLDAALAGGATTLAVDVGAYALSGSAAILTGPPPPVTPLTYPGGSFTNRVFRVVRS